MKDTILVSACLLGVPCRYDGKSKPNESIIGLKEFFNVIPVCPEHLGGLETPRLPCEIQDGKVIRSDGIDLTLPYESGAEKVLQFAKEYKVLFAVLKEKSPSCGKNFRYDGTFSQRLIKKSGITAALLIENGFTVYSEEEIDLIPKSK